MNQSNHRFLFLGLLALFSTLESMSAMPSKPRLPLGSGYCRAWIEGLFEQRERQQANLSVLFETMDRFNLRLGMNENAGNVNTSHRWGPFLKDSFKSKPFSVNSASNPSSRKLAMVAERLNHVRNLSKTSSIQIFQMTGHERIRNTVSDAERVARKTWISWTGTKAAGSIGALVGVVVGAAGLGSLFFNAPFFDQMLPTDRQGLCCLSCTLPFALATPCMLASTFFDKARDRKELRLFQIIKEALGRESDGPWVFAHYPDYQTHTQIDLFFDFEQPGKPQLLIAITN